MPKDKAPRADDSPVGKIEWLDEVADHDYKAAEAYLSIKLDKAAVDKAIGRLPKAPLTTRRANDILRAAGLADGYHRVSLVYRVDPYGVVPLKLA